MTPVRMPMPANPGPRALTQAALEEFLALEGPYRRREELRREILAALEAGAVADPGPLDATMSVDSALIVTRAKLAAVVGEAEVRRILTELEPTPERFLTVAPRPKPPRPKNPRPKNPGLEAPRPPTRKRGNLRSMLGV